MLLHKTVRCSLGENSLFQIIDNTVGKFGNTRLEAAEAIMASAMEEPIKVWFECEDEIIAIQLPTQYVELCIKQGYTYERIVHDCIERGIKWLETTPR